MSITKWEAKDTFTDEAFTESYRSGGINFLNELARLIGLANRALLKGIKTKPNSLTVV